jgi:hypothetical protein
LFDSPCFANAILKPEGKPMRIWRKPFLHLLLGMTAILAAYPAGAQVPRAVLTELGSATW